jgi:hypothetical protein
MEKKKIERFIIHAANSDERQLTCPRDKRGGIPIDAGNVNVHAGYYFLAQN